MRKVNPKKARQIVKENMFEQVNRRFSLSMSKEQFVTLEEEVRGAINKRASFAILDKNEIPFSIMLIVFLIQIKRRIKGRGLTKTEKSVLERYIGNF